MRFIIDSKIFSRYPNVRVGVIVVHNISNQQSSKRVQDLLANQIEQLKAHFSAQKLITHPHLKVWQKVYADFADNRDYISSVTNLANRILKGSFFKSINPLVDLYNATSLQYLLPMGGNDLDKIEGDIELGYAQAVDAPVLLLGQQKPYVPVQDEVIYKDKKGIMCARWNWREAERTKLTFDTRNAIIFIDAIDAIDDALLRDAVNVLAHRILQECGGLVSTAILDEKNPSIIIKKDGEYVALNLLEKSDEKNWKVYDMVQHDQEPSLSAESQARLEKVHALQKQHICPWPENKEVFDTCKQIIDQFERHDQQASYMIAGRLVALRKHGKTVFGQLFDATGSVQIYLKKDLLGEQKFSFFDDYIDLGDILWMTGSSFRTKMGEITLEVTDISLLSKCLHPLPEKFHGLADVETRYRQRYLDLISSQESRQKFKKRSAIIKALRDYLDAHNFLEVETPMLHPIAGGAAARPFITHHNALSSDFYLRIAPELYLKRLVIGGFERVYEINRNFRNEGISTRHNPEFTMLEFYIAYHDYHFMMNFVEALIKDAAQKALHTLQVPFGAHILDFEKPFERISVFDSIVKYAKISPHALNSSTIDQTLKEHNVPCGKQDSLQKKLYLLFEKAVESHLIQPTFITHYPIEISPLSKRDPQDAEIAARYELFIAGLEISNGFNELNDPFDQAERFRMQVQAHKAGDEEAHQFDADYIAALEYGLPPTAGAGIGIDRLVMLLTNTTSIKDVILFPTLKKK